MRAVVEARRFFVGAVVTMLLVAASSFALTSSVGAASPPSFPAAKWAKALGKVHLSSPVVADVNGDGHLDVLTADLAGALHVLDGRNGHDLPGWPQPVQVNPGQTVAVESSPTVADLDRNGRKEIIVGAGSVDYPGQQGGVVAFNANGSVRWRLKTMTVANVNGVQGTPAVGDVNGDGFPDVVFGSFDQRIYALDRFGRPLPGFPWYSQDTIWDSPALYDSGHIGRMDIFIGGDASPGGPCGPTWSWAGVMRAMRVTASGPTVLWQHCQHQIFQSSPAIGDLDGSGRMAVVFGTGVAHSGDAVATESLSALYLDNGSPVSGWPVRLSGAIFGSPVIGDVTGDKRNDVVVGTFDRRVWALSGHGHRLWNKFGSYLSTPILVDLDGSGANDVAIGDTAGLNFFRGRDGARLYNSVALGRVIEDSAAVADFGPGYGWRLIVQSGLNNSGLVESYPLPKKPRIAPAWPQWRLRSTHIASPPPVPLPPAHAGYWLVASDGGIFSYGNAKFYGSTGAMHLNRPIVGMSRTLKGHGYWLVASDGGMFSFGDAKFYGSTGAMHLNRPIVGMARSSTSHGYWLVASDGGMFTFGDAKYYGSTGGQALRAPIVTLTPSTTGHGYWLAGQNGDVFPFGDAQFFGSAGGGPLNQPIVTAAASSHT